VPYPIVALVGYTNAGKSTLFNRLTAADVFAENLLFATLDPTARAIKLPHGETAILSDTVGFISDLPTMLVAAFRATLEDVIEADVLLHVRDVSHGETEAEAADVRGVLHDLGIDPDREEQLLEVWNKADLLDEAERNRLATLVARIPPERRPVLVSAATGGGGGELLQAIERRNARGKIHRHPFPEDALRRAAAAIRAFAAKHEGLVFEDKGASVALHYRLAPQLASAAHNMVRKAASEVGDDVEVQGGKMVAELKPSSRDKGIAIQEFLRERPFSGRTPVFIGDDLTDEYGFAVVNKLGGHTIKVGRGETAARWRISDAAAVRRWLAAGLERPA